MYLKKTQWFNYRRLLYNVSLYSWEPMISRDGPDSCNNTVWSLCEFGFKAQKCSCLQFSVEPWYTQHAQQIQYIAVSGYTACIQAQCRSPMVFASHNMMLKHLHKLSGYLLNQIKSGFIYIAHFKTIFGRAKVLYIQIINNTLLQSQKQKTINYNSKYKNQTQGNVRSRKLLLLYRNISPALRAARYKWEKGI